MLLPLLLSVAMADAGLNPALIPGRQCAAFVLQAIPIFDTPDSPTGRVASVDRGATDRTAMPAEPTSAAPVEDRGHQARPTERVASDQGQTAVSANVKLLGLAPVMDTGSISSLPDGWIPVGGGPAVVPTSKVGTTQYYEVRNYVIACESMATVTPMTTAP